MPQSYECLSVETDGEVAVVRLEAEASEIDSLQKTAAELDRLVEADGHRKFIIDLGKIELLQSSGLGTFVGFEKKVVALGGQVCLCNLRPYVVELFEMTGLDTVVEIFGDEKSARASF